MAATAAASCSSAASAAAALVLSSAEGVHANASIEGAPGGHAWGSAWTRVALACAGASVLPACAGLPDLCTALCCGGRCTLSALWWASPAMASSDVSASGQIFCTASSALPASLPLQLLLDRARATPVRVASLAFTLSRRWEAARLRGAGDGGAAGHAPSALRTALVASRAMSSCAACTAPARTSPSSKMTRPCRLRAL